MNVTTVLKSAPSQPSATGDAAAPSTAEVGALRFTAGIMLAAILLQRFAIPLGDQPLSLVGPVGLGLGLLGLWRGSLTINRRRLAAFLALCGLAMVGSVVSIVLTPPMFPTVSWTSAAHFLALTSFAVLGFTVPVDSRRFFRVVQTTLVLVALAGITQFAVQFAGLGLFTFQGIVPDNLLLPGWNTAISFSEGSTLFKANGFFLIEPSVFSQFMAVGMIIEVLVLQRLRYLVLFPVGLMLSASGTGWIVLGAFLLRVVLGMGGRGVLIALGTVLVAALGMGGLAIALPDVFAEVMGRTDEFRFIGTSGHERFVTPWWALQYVVSALPHTLLIGLGAGTSEEPNLQLNYVHTVNTPVKLIVEYGVPALLIYISLYVLAKRDLHQSVLLFPLLVLVLFTGGYQQFPGVLFPTLLLTTVAQLRPPPGRADASD